MRDVSAAMTAAWRAPDKTGDRRPTVRATLQIWQLQKFPYDTDTAPGSDYKTRHRNGNFNSAIFGEAHPVRELPSIKSLSWGRSVDQDVATATLTMFNSENSPVGVLAEDEGTLDRPGYLNWEADTPWRDHLVPDRIVKTYEGYGINPFAFPGFDENLEQTGVWLIDTVTYTADGLITLTMRDLGRLLLDRIVFPPVVPYAEYPLSFEKIHRATIPSRDAKGGSWTKATGKATSSNNRYLGKGLRDPKAGGYVQANGVVNGHHANHALNSRAKPESYWLSTGQDNASSKVWWEVDLSSKVDLAAVRIRTRRGPYRVYVSVRTPQGWAGRREIPYEVTTGDVDLKAGIPFVRHLLVDRGAYHEITLPKKYRDVSKVRLTFTHLSEGIGDYPFRASLYDVELYTGQYSQLSFGKGQIVRGVGNYIDYTDIVKTVTAWAGFYWPGPRTRRNFMQYSAPRFSGERAYKFSDDDPALPPGGRVWGDFQSTGTGGIADLTVDLFDKKPLMDVINYVRDVVGFNFFIDETGGVVWRLPNVWEKGNYLTPHHLLSRGRKRTSKIITIDEETTLLDYSMILDSTNLRERIFVGNNTGKIGVTIAGFTPHKTGLMRTAGWTDQHFETRRETRIMADLVATRQLHSWRTARLSTPGYPALQIDDQIKIREKVTGEDYYHYITGISSTLDMETGEWIYELETHWLGRGDRAGSWVAKTHKLDKVTRAYLSLVGAGE